MRVTAFWTGAGELERSAGAHAPPPPAACLRCSGGRLRPATPPSWGRRPPVGDPTEVALLESRASSGVGRRPAGSGRPRRARLFHFDPGLRRMSTADEHGGGLASTPRERRRRCSALEPPGPGRGRGWRSSTTRRAQRSSAGRSSTVRRKGLRLLAIAGRPRRRTARGQPRRGRAELTSSASSPWSTRPGRRSPPRSHAATRPESGIHASPAITGHRSRDRPRGRNREPEPRVVIGSELEAMASPRSTASWPAERELIFARSSPEAKLRIADALREPGRSWR